MLKVSAERFVEAGSYLARIRHTAQDIELSSRAQGEFQRPLTPTERTASGIDERLRDLKAECEPLDMRLTVKQIDRLLAMSQLIPEDIMALSVEIYSRFIDELSERQFYSIRSANLDFYEKPFKDWEAVIERFGCSFDVEEGRKCLALERYTASVFHLMKVVEAAVLELQIFLKDRDVKAHFGSVLAKLEDMTQKQKYEHVPTHLQSYLPFLREVLTQLHAVKDSWRNKASHVDARIIPIDTFTEELARGVHDATLLLMKKLAEGLPPKTA